MIYLIQCQDRIKVGWTNKPFDLYLTWLQNRIPFELKVLAIRAGTEDEEKEFHRDNSEWRADWGGREWYGLEMLEVAREFLRLPVNVSLD